MPFSSIPGNRHPTWDPKNGSNEPEVILRQVSPTTFQLIEGFRYEVPGGGERFEVPAHDLERKPADANNSTDLASVPQLLWWFIGSFGVHTRAALFHDHFVDAVDENGGPPSRARRGEIDRAFERALGESELRWVRRKLVWAAVSLRTSWGRLGVGLVLAHVALFAALFVWWVLGGPAWPALLAGAGGFVWGLRPPYRGLAGFAWGMARWPLAVLAFVMVGPPTVVVWVALQVGRFADFLEELVAAAGRAISRRTPLDVADTDRKFKVPPTRPYVGDVGPF
jgi:hypothetical protein